jgi:hypothetical protein
LSNRLERYHELRTVIGVDVVVVGMYSGGDDLDLTHHNYTVAYEGSKRT